jgi:hypothetical protein
MQFMSRSERQLWIPKRPSGLKMQVFAPFVSSVTSTLRKFAVNATDGGANMAKPSFRGRKESIRVTDRTTAM